MSEHTGKHHISINNPYRENTKLHRVFNFMNDGCWHPLAAISVAAYRGTVTTWATPIERRTSSALRTIRSHPNLSVRYDGERYCMERSTMHVSCRPLGLSFGEYD